MVKNTSSVEHARRALSEDVEENKTLSAYNTGGLSYLTLEDLNNNLDKFYDVCMVGESVSADLCWPSVTPVSSLKYCS